MKTRPFTDAMLKLGKRSAGKNRLVRLRFIDGGIEDALVCRPFRLGDDDDTTAPLSPMRVWVGSTEVDIEYVEEVLAP